MKKIFLLLTIAICCLTACDNMLTSNYQPSITVTMVVTASGDTLLGHVDEYDNYTLDTICLGDTALFCIYNQSFANNLTSSYMTWDTTMAKCWTNLTDEFSAILEPTSRPEDLYFDYVTGYNQTLIPVYVFPLKAGKMKMEFHVASDSKYGSNSGSITMVIAEPKAVNNE